MTPRLEGLVAVRLVAHDPDRLVRFYAEALGAEVGARTAIGSAEAARVGGGERWSLSIGAQRLDLDAFDHPGAPYPPDVAADDPRFQHVAMVTADIEAVFARACRCGARLISPQGPVRLPEASGGGSFVKLRDPEGHPFELIALPPGPWDGVAANAQGVRGIDHSAITVSDLAASRRFYADLGLVERNATFNRGPAQAALDDLDAPEVDVAPLFAPGGTPHLELLAYHRPTRPLQGVADRDVAATRLVWTAAGIDGPLLLLRDPDGHRHLVDAP